MCGRRIRGINDRGAQMMEGGTAMTLKEIMHLIDRSLFADLGFMDVQGRPGIRKVFCVWHRGLRRHLISTNTSSAHVQSLQRNGEACLYFADSERFEGLCLSGRAVVHFERSYRELLWHDGDEKYYPGSSSTRLRRTARRRVGRTGFPSFPKVTARRLPPPSASPTPVAMQAVSLRSCIP